MPLLWHTEKRFSILSIIRYKLSRGFSLGSESLRDVEVDLSDVSDDSTCTRLKSSVVLCYQSLTNAPPFLTLTATSADRLSSPLPSLPPFPSNSPLFATFFLAVQRHFRPP